MSSRSTRYLRAVMSVALLALAGCSEITGSDEDEGLNLSGGWGGVSRLGTQGRSTSMQLTQSGAAVTGTMRLSGVMVDRLLTGTVEGENFVFFVAMGCERWTGVLTANADRSRLTGAITQDLSNCPSGSGTSGTVTLDRN